MFIYFSSSGFSLVLLDLVSDFSSTCCCTAGGTNELEDDELEDDELVDVVDNEFRDDELFGVCTLSACNSTSPVPPEIVARILIKVSEVVSILKNFLSSCV
jgi:hypothetical protein